MGFETSQTITQHESSMFCHQIDSKKFITINTTSKQLTGFSFTSEFVLFSLQFLYTFSLFHGRGQWVDGEGLVSDACCNSFSISHERIKPIFSKLPAYLSQYESSNKS
jgi:hypothetical protein